MSFGSRGRTGSFLPLAPGPVQRPDASTVPGGHAFWSWGTGLETRLSLAPGQNGTKRLLARFGERLVRVRHRYDSERKVRIKTVELIVETVPWTPRPRVSRLQAEARVNAGLAGMGLNYTAVDQSVEITRERVNAGVCFVAVTDGEIIGTIVVEGPADDPECPFFSQLHVASAHQLGVLPSHQRKGVGSRLLEHAESWARANGYSELALDTAEPAQDLVALYQRRGYEHVGSSQGRGKAYRSVFMSKRLEHAA